MDNHASGIIVEINGKIPVFGEDCWIAPNAAIIGNVITGNHCSFWFGSVIRGDVNSIRIGHNVNVQDLALIHCTFENASTSIGNEVSIGHGAIVHGCTIHDRVLIGMGAIVMDGAVVHSGSIIAAGAVVLEGTLVEPGSLYAGTPAKKVKSLDPGESAEKLARIASNYRMYSSWYRK